MLTAHNDTLERVHGSEAVDRRKNSENRSAFGNSGGADSLDLEAMCSSHGLLGLSWSRCAARTIQCVPHTRPSAVLKKVRREFGMEIAASQRDRMRDLRSFFSAAPSAMSVFHGENLPRTNM